MQPESSSQNFKNMTVNRIGLILTSFTLFLGLATFIYQQAPLLVLQNLNVSNDETKLYLFFKNIGHVGAYRLSGAYIFTVHQEPANKKTTNEKTLSFDKLSISDEAFYPSSTGDSYADVVSVGLASRQSILNQKDFVYFSISAKYPRWEVPYLTPVLTKFPFMMRRYEGVFLLIKAEGKSSWMKHSKSHLPLFFQGVFTALRTGHEPIFSSDLKPASLESAQIRENPIKIPGKRRDNRRMNTNGISRYKDLFALFYAVFFGSMLSSCWGLSLFQWGQFFVIKEARRRLLLSFILLNILPVTFFLLIYQKFPFSMAANIIGESCIIFLIALTGLSVFAFYRLFHLIITFDGLRNLLYSPIEYKDDSNLKKRLQKIPLHSKVPNAYFGQLLAVGIYLSSPLIMCFICRP